MRRFLFLISTERSGSNFITSLMNGHSRICGPPPSHLFRLFGTNRGNYGDLESDRNWNLLIDDLVESFDCKLGSWSTGVTVEELRERVRKRSVAELLRFVYEKEAEHDGARHLFIKENHTYSFVPFLLAHFPDCRFVWLVRDPRDVASSRVSTRGIPGGVAEAVEVWVRDQTATLALYHQLRDSGRILRVRYEDLVRDTSRLLHELTAFSGLAFEDRMLRFFDQQRTVDNAARIDAWANLRRPVLHDNTGKYRRVLSRQDRRYVELAGYELMADLGYACDLVTELPDPDTRAAELAELRPSIHPGGYAIPSGEEEIRARRLAAIKRVLARETVIVRDRIVCDRPTATGRQNPTLRGGATAGPDYSVVVPVYESDRSVVELVERLRPVFENALGASYEVILVDDGSRSPATWATCERLAREDHRVSAIRLMRNYGKPGAVLCGLERARGRWIITIDDDLQQRPEDIPALVRYREHDVVVANFKTRRHSRLVVLASWIKSHFDRIILGLPCKMSPLKLFKAEVARGMLLSRSPYPFIPALLAHVTQDFVPVVVEHQESRHGKSRFTLRRRVKQLSNLLINNSSLLLRWLGVLGLAVASGGFIFAIAVIARKLSGFSPPLPGWSSLIVINLAFGGLILIALAIVGEYLIRILEGISAKPAYLVRQIAMVEPRGDEPRDDERRDDQRPA